MLLTCDIKYFEFAVADIAQVKRDFSGEGNTNNIFIKITYILFNVRNDLSDINKIIRLFFCKNIHNHKNQQEKKYRILSENYFTHKKKNDEKAVFI